jgi:hypothetical protein
VIVTIDEPATSCTSFFAYSHAVFFHELSAQSLFSLISIRASASVALIRAFYFTRGTEPGVDDHGGVDGEVGAGDDDDGKLYTVKFGKFGGGEGAIEC